MKVVITDHRFPDVEQERRAVEAAGGELVVAQTTDEQQVASACRDADGVIAARAAITKNVIAAMERCQIIVRYGIGVDTIDIPAATERGIMVANVPDYCVDEVLRSRSDSAADAEPPDDSRDCASRGRSLGHCQDATTPPLEGGRLAVSSAAGKIGSSF